METTKKNTPLSFPFLYFLAETGSLLEETDSEMGTKYVNI